MVTIKGHEFKEIKVRDSYNRRALQYKNKIITLLKNFGLTEDNIDIPLEGNTLKKAQAQVSWYLWDHHMFYSYNNSDKYVENIAMVAQVIEHFIYLLSEGQITQEEFIQEFKEDDDIIQQRKHAREVLGVEENELDFDKMHKSYKELSKAHHPDMPHGNTQKFQEINRAHKILKKEMNAM
ncbi:MAG: J domain-containing protein [Nanoarchaeota archaeon]|nr:J domain-containing protein [Nanoarchaeota archaeon]MBU1704262.1 J domain-containing protein [Nanoarchaeota archaeon]